MPTPTNGPDLTVISRVGCHLCGDAEEITGRLGAELGLTVTVKDVDRDIGLQEYTDLVPVVLIDGEMHQHWRIDEERLRRALEPRRRRRWWRATR